MKRKMHAMRNSHEKNFSSYFGNRHDSCFLGRLLLGGKNTDNLSDMMIEQEIDSKLETESPEETIEEDDFEEEILEDKFPDGVMPLEEMPEGTMPQGRP